MIPIEYINSVLEAIKQGYDTDLIVVDTDNYFIRVDNPKYVSDDGSDPFLAIQVICE